MRKHYYLILFCCLLAHTAFAQAPKWADSCIRKGLELEFVGKPTDLGVVSEDLHKLSNGTLIVTGNYYVGDSGRLGIKMFVANLQITGELIWIKYYAVSEAETIDEYTILYRSNVTPQDEILIAYGARALPRADNDGPTFMKLDALGNVIWRQQLKVSAAWFSINSIKQMADGNILACGSTLFSALAVKLNQFGEILWTKLLNSDLAYFTFFDVTESAFTYDFVTYGTKSSINTSKYGVVSLEKELGTLFNGYVFYKETYVEPTDPVPLFEQISYDAATDVYTLTGGTGFYFLSSTSSRAHILFQFNSRKEVKTAKQISYTEPGVGNGFALGTSFDWKTKTGVVFDRVGTKYIYYKLDDLLNPVWARSYNKVGQNFPSSYVYDTDSTSVVLSWRFEDTSAPFQRIRTAFNVLNKTNLNSTCTVTDANITVSDNNIDTNFTCRASGTCRLGEMQFAKTQFCLGDTTTVTSIKQGECGDSITYKIIEGAAMMQVLTERSARFTFNQPGIVKVVSNLTSVCKVLTDTLVFTVNAPIKPTITDVAGFCPGGSATLKVSPTGFASYLWQDGSTKDSLQINSIGTYIVYTIDSNGCKSDDSADLIALYPVPTQILATDTFACREQALELSTLVPYANYKWKNGSTARSITVTQPGQYYVEVENQFGCKNSDTINIGFSNCKFIIFFPTSFSPNNDGTNDVFKPFVEGALEKYELSIFNRWGKKIFVSNSHQQGWDGTIGGKPQGAGMFAFICKFKFFDAEPKTINGTILVLR
jgi:gliding motility-associated-like protein